LAAARTALATAQYGLTGYARLAYEIRQTGIGETAMEVILKEDVNKLGHRGDVVKVADGYGRNYLLPGKLAIEANAANKAVVEQMKGSAVRKSAKEKTEAESLSTQLNEIELTFERKVGENEHLFGSVTSGDIAHQLEEKGFTIDRRKISLEEPLKTIGEYHVPVKLHREVTSHIKVTVKGDQPEAVAVAAE
jgi:large subunit ribosomal protein L9